MINPHFTDEKMRKSGASLEMGDFIDTYFIMLLPGKTRDHCKEAMPLS